MPGPRRTHRRLSDERRSTSDNGGSQARSTPATLTDGAAKWRCPRGDWSAREAVGRPHQTGETSPCWADRSRLGLKRGHV